MINSMILTLYSEGQQLPPADDVPLDRQLCYNGKANTLCSRAEQSQDILVEKPSVKTGVERASVINQTLPFIVSIIID